MILKDWRAHIVIIFIFVVAAIIVMFAVVKSLPLTIREIEQDIQSHFESINTTDLNCYGMSEIVKEYVEGEYDYPVVYVHGETTQNLKSLYHTWLMIKIDGNWREFESTKLEFRDVSNSFELTYMTYNYEEVEE